MPELFRNPITGNPITREQALMLFGDAGENLPRYVMPATDRPDAPSLKRDPVCPGCGTSVANQGDVCSMCEGKPQFQAPKGSFAVGVQERPAYQREVETPTHNED